MNSDLKITTENAQGSVPITVLHLRGWLDAQSEEKLLAEARVAYENGARYLLLDMSELDTLTSAGIRAIQKVYQIFTPKEEHLKVSRLKLCNAPPQIYNVLGITGFLHNVPMYASQADAIDAFGKDD